MLGVRRDIFRRDVCRAGARLSSVNPDSLRREQGLRTKIVANKRCDFGIEEGFQAGRLRLPGIVPFTGCYAFWRWRIASLLMQTMLCNPASAGDSGCAAQARHDSSAS